MLAYFKEVIEPLVNDLDKLLNADKTNDLGTYTRDGITHIYVFGNSTEYKLVNGEWLEQPPF